MNIPKLSLLLISFLFILIYIFTPLHGCGKKTEVESVKSSNLEKQQHKIICPYCRRRVKFKDFKNVDVPNIKQCPECNKRIPLPLLLRQKR